MAGQVIPLLAAVLAIPMLIDQLGVDRVGFLTLIWVLIGYFSLFDMGIGRALTYLVARNDTSTERADVAGIIWTAVCAGLALGMIGSSIVAVFAPSLVERVLAVPPVMRDEALGALYWVAASIPVMVLTAIVRGLLQARHRFDLVNIVGIPSGIWYFVGPLLVAPLSPDLTYATGALVFGRTAACAAYLRMCLSAYDDLRSGMRSMRWAYLGDLARFGGWLTISNIIGPLTLYADRFLLGSIVSVSLVAYYTVPYEMVTKLLIVAGAIGGVVFPAFSATYGSDPARTRHLFVAATRYTFLATYPAALLLVFFADEILRLWLNAEFADKSALVLQIIGVGVFVYGLATVPSMLIQAVGRPDLLTKLNLIELPFYFVAIWFLTVHYGIVGTAIAWFLRVTFDGTLITTYALHHVAFGQAAMKRAATVILCALSTMIPPFTDIQLAHKVIGFVVVVTLFAWSSWRYMLNVAERETIARWLGRR